MTVRWAHIPIGAAERIDKRIAKLAKDGSILIVSSRQPLAAVRKRLAASGADTKHVFTVDVTPEDFQRLELDRDHEAIVAGPSLLELIASRVRTIIRTMAERRVTIIVDDVTSFAIHNTPAALGEIVHMVAGQLAGKHDLEFMHFGEPSDPVMANIWAGIDERHHLGPLGGLNPVSDGKGP